MRTLYYALLVSIVAILAVAGALYWRVRRLANASRTQFIRAVKAADETGKQPQVKS
jgi:flagellar biogenesis protein FliO